MNSSKTTFIIILVMLLSVYFTVNFRTQSTYKDLNKQIDSLEHSVSVNNTIIESYDKKMDIIRDSIIQIDNKIVVIKDSIAKLDKEYDKKFDSITSFYSSDLQEYVANRYKDK
jgi:peptidoglycan hydrolase CwlO-like protein